MDKTAIQEAFHTVLQETDFSVSLEPKGLVKVFVVATAAVIVGNVLTYGSLVGMKRKAAKQAAQKEA